MFLLSFVSILCVRAFKRFGPFNTPRGVQTAWGASIDVYSIFFIRIFSLSQFCDVCMANDVNNCTVLTAALRSDSLEVAKMVLDSITKLLRDDQVKFVPGGSSCRSLSSIPQRFVRASATLDGFKSR